MLEHQTGREKNKETMVYKRKYLWASEDFNQWVKAQSIALKKQGNMIEPSEITHRLFHDVIKPNNLSFIQQPIKIGGNKKLTRKRIF